jgi:uncharacterized protein
VSGMARKWNWGRIAWLALVLLALWLAVAVYREHAGQALIDAIGKDDTRTVETLLARGADPNTRRDRKDRFRGLPTVLLAWFSRETGWSALMIAALSESDNVEIVDRLLSRGAHVNAKGWMGATPLTHAADAGNVQVLKTLLKHGADVNQVGAHGHTALMIASGALPGLGRWVLDEGAVKGRRLEMVKILLGAGADVNARSSRGQTALMFAADQGRKDIVRVLVAHGADLRARDRYGRTALDHAETTGEERVAKPLQ